MKQIKTFKIPDEEAAANNFLAKYPPEQVGIVGDRLVINFDDQAYPDTYKAEELRALMLSNTKQRMTTEISIAVSKLELEKAEKELVELQATVVSSTSKKTKEIYDLTKDRNDKIKAYTDRVNNIKNAIKGLESSLDNFQFKNEVMKRVIASLNL